MIEELKKLEMKVSQALEEIINLREEKRSLLARIRELEEAREEQRLLVDKIKELESRCKQYKSQEKRISELAEERDEFRQKAVQLQNQVNELIESRREYDQWEERKKEVQTRLSALIERISVIEAEKTIADDSLEAILEHKTEDLAKTIEEISSPSFLVSEENIDSMSEETAGLVADDSTESSPEDPVQTKEEAKAEESIEKEPLESNAGDSSEEDNPTLEFPSEYFRSSDS
jgi:chromosome segregation ATPase